jgi:hypothetical protein
MQAIGQATPENKQGNNREKNAPYTDLCSLTRLINYDVRSG